MAGRGGMNVSIVVPGLPLYPPDSVAHRSGGSETADLQLIHHAGR